MKLQEIKKYLKRYKEQFDKSPIHKYLREIYYYEKDEIIKAIIKENIYGDKTNTYLISVLPVSESDYFRLKNHLIDKIYHLMILDKKVDRDEILSEF